MTWWERGRAVQISPLSLNRTNSLATIFVWGEDSTFFFSCFLCRAHFLIDVKNIDIKKFKGPSDKKLDFDLNQSLASYRL